MSNIFRHTSDTYFQIPKKIIKDRLLIALSQPAKDLLLYLLYEAQEKSTSVLLLPTSRVLERTGISRYRPFRDARGQLALHGLVLSEEVKSGLWRYEIVTRTSIQDIDLDALSRSELENFFSSRLGDDSRPDDNGLRFTCPFHINRKREQPFSVKLVHTDDGPGPGVWHCFQCERSGKLIELEKQIARHNNQPIESHEAHKRVTQFFAKLRDDQEEEQLRKERAALL